MIRWYIIFCLDDSLYHFSSFFSWSLLQCKVYSECWFWFNVGGWALSKEHVIVRVLQYNKIHDERFSTSQCPSNANEWMAMQEILCPLYSRMGSKDVKFGVSDWLIACSTYFTCGRPEFASYRLQLRVWVFFKIITMIFPFFCNDHYLSLALT